MINTQHNDNLTADEQQLIALSRAGKWMELILLAAEHVPAVEPVEPTAEELAAAEAAKQARLAATVESMKEAEAERHEEHYRLAWAIMGALIAAHILPEPGREFANEQANLCTAVIGDTLNAYANW